MNGTLPVNTELADGETRQVLDADVFEAEALESEVLDAEGGEHAPVSMELFRQGADRCAGEEMKPLLIFVDSRPLTRASIAQFLDSSVPGLDVVAFSGLEEFLGGESQEIGALALIVLNIGPTEITEDIVQADIRLLRSALPEIPLIVMSECDDARYVVEALRCGVRGYIPTTIDPSVAVEALRLVQAGGTFIPASALDYALKDDRWVGVEGDDLPRQATATGMTRRELEVLGLLRQGKPNKSIAYELDMNESTVKVHVRHIMRKLKATNRTEAVFIANKLLEQR